MFAFHSTVPPGVRSVTVTFDYVSPAESFGFQGGVTATANLAVVNWNQVLLYPQCRNADELTFVAQLLMPEGWNYGTALPVDAERGNTVSFAPESWSNLRRGTDFYAEGTLIWLAVDTLIRKTTDGQHSLDDFCRSFFGNPGTPPQVSTYTQDDLVAALNGIVPYDWKEFFRRRVESINERAPLDGIEAGGWKLVYTDQLSDFQKSCENVFQTTDVSYSLGLLLNSGGADAEYGKIKDVIMGSPAQTMGVCRECAWWPWAEGNGRPRFFAKQSRLQKTAWNQLNY